MNGRACVSLLIVWLYTCAQLIAVPQSQSQVDSIKEVLYRHPAEDTVRVNLLLELVKGYYSINPDEGINYGHQAENLSRKIDYREGVAKANRYLGSNYLGKSEYDKALEYYSKAFEMESDLGNKQGIGSNLTNMGLVYYNQSEFAKAQDYYLKALDIFEEINFTKGISTCLGNIVLVYTETKNYDKALVYANKALRLDEQLGNKAGQARHLGNIGLIYMEKENLDESLAFYLRSLDLFKQVGDKRGLANILGNISGVYLAKKQYEKALETIRQSLVLYGELGSEKDQAVNLMNMANTYYKVSIDTTVKTMPHGFEKSRSQNLHLAIEYLNEALALNKVIGSQKNLADNYESLSKVEAALGNYKSAYDFFLKHTQLKDTILSSETQKTIAELDAKAVLAGKEKEITVQKFELLRKKRETIALAGAILFTVAMMLLVYRQRRRSDKLLLNILPEKIASRLKKGEKPIADAYEEVSIVFIDIVNFTELSQNASAGRIVEVLNQIFSRFDGLSARHGLEKIKTIGDSYMAAAGIPVKDTYHALKAADFALDVMNEMKNFKTSDGTEICFRAGIDTGSVVGGVIGDSKFIFDLWGDAVNTAARMESSGQTGRIHCTDRFKRALLLLDQHYVFSKLSPMEIKGKGLMQTWMLERKDY